MSDTPRGLAAAMFNATWDLIETPARSAEQDRQMLASAFASRRLWDDIGDAEKLAVGDWLVAHVAALLGYGSLALDFATAAYARAEASDVPLWLKASVCEGVARAHAAAGTAAERDAWIARAEARLAAVADPDARALVASQLATIPR